MPSDLDNLATYLEHVADLCAVPPLAPTVAEVRDDLARSTQANFQGARAPDGTPWVPRKRPYRHPPLIDSGNLFLSAVSQLADAPPTDKGFEADPAWGPDYGSYHWFGTRNLPARPFTGWADPQADAATEKIANGAVDAIEKAAGEA